MISIPGFFAILLLFGVGPAPPTRVAYTVRSPAAQEETKHPIDKALEACIDKNGSTAGMVECTDKAYAAWDRELNRNYGELMQSLKPRQKETLRIAQLEWIKFRDLEFKVIDSVYDTMQGTMYIPMRVDARMEVIRKRALDLKGYLELIKEGE